MLFPGINPDVLSKVVRVRSRKNQPYKLTYQVGLNPPVDHVCADISILYNFRDDSFERSMKLMECGGMLPFGTVLLINPAVSTSGLQPLSTEPIIQFHVAETGLVYEIIFGKFHCRNNPNVNNRLSQERLFIIKSFNSKLIAYVDNTGIDFSINSIPFLQIPAAPTVNSERFFV